jgi:hypothetical protein
MRLRYENVDTGNYFRHHLRAGATSSGDQKIIRVGQKNRALSGRNSTSLNCPFSGVVLNNPGKPAGIGLILVKKVYNLIFFRC